MSKSKLFSAIIVLISITLVACSNARVGENTEIAYNQSPLTVAVPANKASEAMDTAEAVLLGRGWNVESKSETEVIGNLVHRSFDATVAIKKEGSLLVLYSDAEHTHATTKEVNRGVPYGWLQNLQSDLQQKMFVPG